MVTWWYLQQSLKLYIVLKLMSLVELGSLNIPNSFIWVGSLLAKRLNREYWLGSSWWHDSIFNNLVAPAAAAVASVVFLKVDLGRSKRIQPSRSVAVAKHTSKSSESGTGGGVEAAAAAAWAACTHRVAHGGVRGAAWRASRQQQRAANCYY